MGNSLIYYIESNSILLKEAATFLMAVADEMSCIVKRRFIGKVGSNWRQYWVKRLDLG
jgi:hypothetical protein